jgi:PAS domain S-box-containing protein
MATDAQNKVSLQRALQKMAQRIAKGEEVLLTQEEQLGFLRLAHEQATHQTELDRLHDDIRVRDEEFNRLQHDFVAGQRDLFDYLEFIPLAFLMVDKKGIVRRANTAAQSLLTGSSRPLLGSLFSNYIKPEDYSVYFERIKSLSRRHPTVSREIRLLGANDREIMAHVQVEAKFEYSGRFSGWHLAIVDITESHRRDQKLKLVHEQLEMATRSAEIGIWNYDAATGKSQWNKQLYRLFGLEPRQGPEDEAFFFKFIHPDDRVGLLASRQALLAAPEAHIRQDFRIVTADGKTRWLAVRGRIYRNESGRVVRISGVNYDISDRKKAEETARLMQLQLAKQLAETERINEELSQYAYAVSHDLKGPLRAIRNYAQFLYEDLAGSLSGEQKKYLEGLKAAVDQGDTLIQDLLNLSRIDRVPLEAEAADVPGVIDEVVSVLELKNGVELTVAPEWPGFTVDRTLLKQILQNLISNAAKFNRHNPKRIEIGWSSAPEDAVDIFVRDNGIGIDPQYQQQIFRIFQRLHTNRDYEGTGIGLAIVQKAAQKLGGTVRLESEPGKGSTFTLRLPRRMRTVEKQADVRGSVNGLYY